MKASLAADRDHGDDGEHVAGDACELANAIQDGDALEARADTLEMAAARAAKGEGLGFAAGQAERLPIRAMAGWA